MAGEPASPENAATTNQALPNVAPPAERASEKLRFWDYAKNIVMVVVVTKLSALAGYAAGRLTPSSVLPASMSRFKETVSPMTGKKAYPLAQGAAFVTGSAGAFYESWQRWRKTKGKELHVKDIHKDIYTELDPKLLEAEVAQNQRIQDGIKSLSEKIAPRGSYTQAASEEPAVVSGIGR